MNQYDSPGPAHVNLRRSGIEDIHALALLYTLLVIHLSLSPYTGWRDLGAGLFDYWRAPWIPHQQTILWGDIIMNVLGYIPLGLLLTLSGYPRWTGWSGLAIACLTIAGLTCVLEGIQTFLPARVPSRLDCACNMAGGLIGALIARKILPWLWESGAWPQLRQQWLETRTVLGLACMVLWLFALISPQAVPFVIGPWLGDLWLLAATHFGWYDDHNTIIDIVIKLEENAGHLATLMYLLGAWLLGLAQTRPYSPRFRMLLVLVSLTLVIGWFGPQCLPWAQGEPLKTLDEWDTSLRLTLAVAILIALTCALSGWRASTLARMAMGCIALGWSCTLVLPGYTAPLYEVSGQNISFIIDEIDAASTWVALLWPALSLCVAWRLSNFFAK